MKSISEKQLIIIPDTNICDLLYPETKKEFNLHRTRNFYTQKQIDDMSKKLTEYHEMGVLNITEIIKSEFEGRFICKYRNIIKEFWNMFESKTLVNSYANSVGIDEICKNVTNLNKDRSIIKNKMKYRKIDLKKRYDESKKEYELSYVKWENNESCEEFRRIRKNYIMKKRDYDKAVADESYLLIGWTDRAIISSAIDQMEKGFEVHFITTDIGIIYMKKSLEKDFSIIVQGFLPKNKINTKKYNSKKHTRKKSNEHQFNFY